MVLLGLVCWGISYFLNSAFTDGDPIRTSSGVVGTASGLFLAGSAIYFTSMLKHRGQTLGKMAVGIKVIKTDASQLGWSDSLRRFAGYVLSWLTLHLLFLKVAVDRHRQGVHDHMADTYVIVVPKKRVSVPQAQPYVAHICR